MDTSTLMKLVLSANSTGAISQNTGVSQEQITSVLSSVMPMLLEGASAQATGKDTADSFAQALDIHGEKDTKDLSQFLGGVDLGDAAKILQHLLGGNTSSTVSAAAKKSGVSEANALKIITLAAPLLMTVLGQQKKKHGTAGSALLQMVMGGSSNESVATSVLGILGKLMK